MSARVAAILVALLVVLGGAALLFQRQESGHPPEAAAALGKRVLPDLKAAEVARIRIAQQTETLTLERKEDGWVIAERDGFPADFGKVRDFVLKMIELKIGQSEPIGEKDRARLNLDASGSRVELLTSENKTLASLVVGRKYFKREVDNPDKAPADGRFVLRADAPGTVYIVSDPLAQASAKSADWIDRTAFKVEKVKTLEVRFADGAGWRIQRPGDNADWKLAGAKPGEKLDIGRANAASYSLSLLELDDVAAKDAKQSGEMSGLDRPTIINATTLDGASYAIKVGRTMGEDYYVTFTSSRDDAREKRLSAYTLLIPKSKLEDTLKPRAELLEKKPAAKKK
ncbi:MAG TPA: DUF4340 domain-containing protein [Burkholderiales bacterium]|nr:DUF4340 domain-containing protein [Burkholderiales bacterium]